MRPVILIILDGWGHSTQRLGNAILSAKTPTIDTIKSNYPTLLLQASGESVGLRWGEAGNSEVGNAMIGAGRTVFQYSARIDNAINSGAFFENPALLNAATHAKKNQSRLHIIGLLGSGTVHSSLDHLRALLDLAKQQSVEQVLLHLYTDGKDSGLKEAPTLVKTLQTYLEKNSIGKIASIIGRQYALDRDNNWDRTEAAYNLWIKGQGQAAINALDALSTYYAQDLDDMQIPPTLLDPAGTIKDNDAIIFFDFREDSMRQIARAFVEPKFDKFPRQNLENLYVALMTQYMEEPGLNLNVAFPRPEINNGLAEILSTSGKKQLHIAESEKYAHTTYFFNCLRSTPFEGETDKLIDSYKKHTEHPEMKALEIAETCIQELEKNLYDFVVINLANADVLSHLGDLDLAIKGVEFVDKALAKIYNAVLAKDAILLITSDHGNAEALIYRGTGRAETKHNNNPVPVYVVASEYARPRSQAEAESIDSQVQGLLSDIAPTILDLMSIQKPVEMTGTSLLGLLS